MKMTKQLGLFIVLAILLPILGAVAGFLAGRAWNNGSFERWQRLPDPPARPVEIVGGSTSILYIKTADDKVYSCQLSDNNRWVADEVPASLSPKNDACDQYPIHYSVSPAPGKIIDSLQTQWCHFEAGEETDYAVLEDGSVWVWRHFDANFLNIARALTPLGGGCCGGLLIGIAGVVTVLLRQRSQASQTAS